MRQESEEWMDEQGAVGTIAYRPKITVMGHNFRQDKFLGTCRFCNQPEQGHGVEMRRCTVCDEFDSEIYGSICGTCAQSIIDMRGK